MRDRTQPCDRDPTGQSRPLLAIGTTLALLLSACSPDRPEARSVLLISIDTLRADRLGCTGYPKAATPNLDALANEGAVYTHGVAPAPLTLPSHATLLSGLLPIEHGVRDNRPFAFPHNLETLATRFASRGYATRGVIGAEPLAPGCGLERGFEEYNCELPATSRGAVRLAERPADQVTDAALRAMESVNRQAPYFLFVHYFDPHDPYVPPEPFASRFANSPYDGEIAYVDQQVGRLLRTLRSQRRIDDRTIILVVSDHGESLGEHGEPTHGLFAYDATIRVPVLLRDVGGARGKIADPVRLADVHDFLLARAAGESKDLAAPGLRGEPALVESLYGALHCNYAQLRGIRTPDGKKYLEAGTEELYDLTADPGETANLAAAVTESASVQRAREALQEILAELTAGEPAYQSGSLVGYLSTPRSGGPIQPLTRAENAARPSPWSERESYADMQEGIRLLQIGLTEAAILQLNAAVLADAENPTAHFWRGQALKRAALNGRDAERMNEAFLAYTRAHELNPDDGRPRDLSIFCLAQLGRFEEAKDLADQAIEGGTATAGTREVLGKICLTTPTDTIIRATNPYYSEKLAEEHLMAAFELDANGLDLAILEWLLPRYLARGDSVHAAAIRQRIAAEAPNSAPSGGGRP